MGKDSVSTVNWVLEGARSHEGKVVSEEELALMLEEAFMPGRTFKLFLSNLLIDKTGTLEEMEDGYFLVRRDVPEYSYGDYGIVSTHSNGELLFMPLENKDMKDESISGNTDLVQQ